MSHKNNRSVFFKFFLPQQRFFTRGTCDLCYGISTNFAIYTGTENRSSNNIVKLHSLMDSRGPNMCGRCTDFGPIRRWPFSVTDPCRHLQVKRFPDFLRRRKGYSCLEFFFLYRSTMKRFIGVAKTLSVLSFYMHTSLYTYIYI